MYTVKLNDSLPKNNNLVFINKTNKIFIHVDLNDHNGEIEATISKSDDGINLQFPVTNEHAVNTMPPLSGDLAVVSLVVIKHFKESGFKLVDTITATKDGLKFR